MIENISTYVDAHRENIVRCLKSLVDQKGGSEDAEAVNRVGNILTSEFLALNFSLEKFDGHAFGDHLLFKNHTREKSIILAGHMDTTFTSYERLPEFRARNNRCIGPGTGDMLGGLVVFLYAVKCLHRIGKLNQIPLTIFLNSDEERGSPTSRPVFEKLVQEAIYALVAESAGHKGEIVIGRRGKLSFDILVNGIEGHAGNLVGRKSSAVEEIAHKIIAIEGLNSRWDSADFNVGKVQGGIAGNTIAQHATLSSDVRYTNADHATEIKEAINRIVEENQIDGCQSKLLITSERPLWDGRQNTDGQKAFIEIIRLAAEELQIPFGIEVRKGTSDANFFGARGVSVVDGIGPIGFHDHSVNEYILLDSLFDRIKLCTFALCRMYSV
ncbi:MAG: M20/M25/M40 family metallo-hydrolase [Desulfobulbaceae bacterium]|nr:M20/M25/M40 family metallo-hydrolase [Desulfobulbaceae bacterium]